MEFQQEQYHPVTQDTQHQQCRSKWRALKNLSPKGQKDGPYAYFVCLCGFICILLPTGCAFSYGILFPVLLAEFKEGRAKTAWVGSLAYASGSLFAPLVGLLCDRFSHRKVAISGGILSCLSLLVTSQAPNLTLMYFTFGLAFGFGCCCLYFVSVTIIPKYFLKRRALATGFVIMGPGAGLFVMSPIIQTLLNATTSWRMTLIIMAGITFVTCLLPCSFGTNIANDKCQINTSADKNCEGRSSLVALATAGRVSSSQLCSTLSFSYLKNKEFVIYVIAGVICFCGMTVPNVHMARYCQERGLDANQPFVMYLFNGVASAVSRVLTGYVCDTTRIQPRWIFQISLFLAGLIAILMTLFHSYYELLVCFIFFGMMDGAATSSLCILALFTVSPEERAQGFGFFQFCVGLSLASGPPFGGFLADLSGTYNLTFYVAGSFLVLAGCILFLSYCVQDTKNSREDLRDMMSLENVDIVEKVTVL
ncbi:monocarboxylate transporter 13-like [Porites lutea]|uniref:monocarboxylate transporter 13-like n=1 Tax=Porites lutea TaxID=51062 RepID=UPI003CC641A9